MNHPPAYFDRIRQKAVQRWNQLENDRELAGPWHQLFKQVQSPRHILSELLQNADDAGATEAIVRIEDDVFLFEHDGEDFSEEHFASLCRFGYSNKRSLHTIGFRGVGFKSTFSLGDQVELVTPSLSVCFHRRRFTEPKWLPGQFDKRGRTRVRVKISDQYRQKEVEKNLEEWVKSPVSLLFFKNIRRIRVGEQEIHWRSLGPGPIPESEWMALNEHEENAFLLIRSEAKAFPEEALEEIRQERMLGTEEEGEFPPCKVEIVYGAKGRLFVVLPTGVETELPFACNAPFIQDPARVKIKDPEISPTNRWLLGRAGKLAASAMLDWLDRADTLPSDRAGAYGLFPNVDRDSGSLEHVCGTLVEESFGEAIDGKRFLITENGQLTSERKSVIIPRPVLEIWPPELAVALLDEEGRPPLCQHVKATDRKKLLQWGFIEEIDKQKVLGILREKHFPKPNTWRQLLNLWAYAAPEITGYGREESAKRIRIVPVQGRDVLYAATDVVRLGEKKLLHSEDDWEFLARYLIVLNQNWPRFLAEQRRSASGESGSPSRQTMDVVYAVLSSIGLADTSDVSKVIGQVAAGFFSGNSIAIEECVRLAQIAAKLGASVATEFHYVTRDRRLRSCRECILFDEDGRLEELLPDARRETQLLNSEYFGAFNSCSQHEWAAWIRSGKSGILTMPPIREHKTESYSSTGFLGKLRKTTGYQGAPSFPYTSARTYSYQRYYLIDFDFDSEVVQYWNSYPPEANVLGKLAELLIYADTDTWKSKEFVGAQQTSTNGQSTAEVALVKWPAAWIRRLAAAACLPDSRGFYRKPADLLRRTPETESLMDVEPFIHGRLDREAISLEKAPPVRFDLARQVRVFEPYLQYVELSLTGAAIQRHRLAIPPIIQKLGASKELEDRLRTTFDLIEKGSKLSSKPLEDALNEIRKNFTPSLGKDHGRVVLKAQKPHLTTRLATFRRKLETHQREIAAKLQAHLERSRRQIVAYYVPRVVATPPDALQGQLLTPKPTKDDARHWLTEELDRVFPSAESLIQEMKLDERFKDVTFETLNRDDFLESVKIAFPHVDWDKAYEEFRAAGEAGGKRSIKTGPP